MKQNYTTLKKQLFELRYSLIVAKTEEEASKIKKEITDLKKLMINEMKEVKMK